MHRDRWRHRSGREHGGAGREANLIFVLPLCLRPRLRRLPLQSPPLLPMIQSNKASSQASADQAETLPGK